MPDGASPAETEPPRAQALAALARSRGLDKVAADLEAGRLWKARDRLQGAFIQGRQDQAVLDMLATVLYLMHDLPEAGRFWYLTARDDEHAREARAAFEQRYRGPVEIAHRLPARTPLDEYPEPVRARLERLDLTPWPPATRWEPIEPEPISTSGKIWIALGLALLALLVLALVLGLLQIIGWAVDSIGATLR